MSSSVPTRTVTSAVSGVCCSALVMRLDSTCRSRGSSPSTSGVPGPSNTSMVIVRFGAIERASCTASLASANRSTRRWSSGRCVVESGEQQKILDQQTHPARFALDPAHQHLDIAGRALAVQLGEAGMVVSGVRSS